MSVLAAAGCSQFPSGAPTPAEFRADRTTTPGFLLVDLDPAVAAVLRTRPRSLLTDSFGASNYTPNGRLRAGDQVAVTLFDDGAVPLFGAAAGGGIAGAMPGGAHETALPPQTVGPDGSIAIPFAGHVRVGGLTPVEAGDRIVASLGGRAVMPQAVVSLVGGSINAATVGGDVARPARVPLTLRGERILDAVAAAGGARYEPEDCRVQLIRRGVSGEIGLRQVLDNPAEDLALEPGDQLFVSHDPRTFLVLGAALRVAQYGFDARTVTLAEAIARAGGPNEAIADLDQVYLLRDEDAAVVRRLTPPAARSGQVTSGRLPVAYHLNLRNGTGYFLGQHVEVRNKDIVLMTNASAVQLQKVFAVVRNVTGIYYDIHSRF